MQLSLIIAVYNKPDILRLVLITCARQTFRDFEIIIADDGSGPEIAHVIEEARQEHGFEIQHLWHADDGWQKNIMLNKAIRAARTDYLVFIDGDCLLHHKFLADHWSERAEKYALCGRRVEMGARWAAKLGPEFVRSGKYERFGLVDLWEGLTGRSQRVEDALRITNRSLASLLHGKTVGLLGSNFSIYKRHLEAINGFDALYKTPGCGEDSDIQFRLELAGIKCKSIRHKAIQYHVYHDRGPIPAASLQRLEEVKRRGIYRCEQGLAKLRL
jgi:glycosyltransferase involved in cell wall biosynthesis